MLHRLYSILLLAGVMSGPSPDLQAYAKAAVTESCERLPACLQSGLHVQVNTTVDNIGARRLHTVLERIVEDISFEAPDKVMVPEAGCCG